MWFTLWNDYFIYMLLGVILLPGFIVGAVVQWRLSATTKKYFEITAQSGMPAHEAARRMLDGAGLWNINVVVCKGNLTDHYDHKAKTLALSESVYNSASVTALAIAAHECGHAVQHAKNYVPVKVRAVLVPVVNFTNSLLWPVVLIGLIFGFAADTGIGGEIFMWAGVIMFSGSLLFSLLTLPAEFNASRRAGGLIVSAGALTEAEFKTGGKKVLSAAAWTYIASVLMQILSLLRFLALIFLSRGRRR